MQTFEDAAGRKWTMQLNVAAAKRLKAELEIDLVDGDLGKILTRLAENPFLLADCLYVLCRSECEQRQISDEQFGEGLAGDAIESASEALMQEIVDFFPKARRPIVQATREKAKEADARLTAEVMNQLGSEQFDRLIDREIEKLRSEMVALLRQDGNPSTGSPASSGPTPDPTPSAN